MRRPTIAVLAALAVQGACTAVPDLDAEGLEAALRAPYPALIPLTGALAAADSAPRLSPDEAALLRARGARPGQAAPRGAAAPDQGARLDRLRARAAILRGPLNGPADVETMRRALAAL